MAQALDLRPANLIDRPSLTRAINENQTIANVEAEQAFLGAVLYENSALALLGDGLRPQHFFVPEHAAIWGAILSIVDRSQIADPIMVHDRLEREVSYQEIGGIQFLADLVDRAPPARNAPDYARAILDAATRRHVFELCEDAAHAAIADRERPAFEIAASLRGQLQTLETTSAPEDATMITAPEAALQAYHAMQERAQSGKPRGAMTGLRCIDRRLNGLRPGALIVVGGRPGMGKTSLARACAHGAAARNPDDLVAFFGIEMGPEEMMQRELSAITHQLGDGVEYRIMGDGAVTPMDLANIYQAQQRVPPNLILDDCHTLSIDDVRRKIWALKRRGKLVAVFIDYLQLMRRPQANGRNEASVLGEMTSALKQIARQAGLCIVLLSQLSRQVESRDDKRPVLSDLRESGSIEQDADAVLFPFREFYYVERAEPTDANKRDAWMMRCEELRRRLDVICAKQRQGPVGTDRQRYLAEFDVIEDDRDAEQ